MRAEGTPCPSSCHLKDTTPPARLSTFVLEPLSHSLLLLLEVVFTTKSKNVGEKGTRLKWNLRRRV